MQKRDLRLTQISCWGEYKDVLPSANDLGFYPKNPPWFQSFVLKKAEPLSFYTTQFQQRHGRRWFHAVARFALIANLVDEKCTRMYIFHQGRFTPFVWALGAQGQAEAKIVVAVVRGVVVPFTDDAVLRVIVPTTATYDAFSTGSSTLLMSLPFNTLTAFNLQSNRNGIIVFVELLRKNPVWTLSDFVKIQKIFEPRS